MSKALLNIVQNFSVALSFHIFLFIRSANNKLITIKLSNVTHMSCTRYFFQALGWQVCSTLDLRDWVIVVALARF